MAETYFIGENKVRPGAYFNINKKGTMNPVNYISGVTAVLFKSDFGPLNTAIEIDSREGYEEIFGTNMTTDAIKEAIEGGARTIIACRVGNGGTEGKIEVKNQSEQKIATLTCKYVGEKEFTLTVREKLTNVKIKEAIIYDGITEFEKVEFSTEGKEAENFVNAFKNSKNFIASLESNKESEKLKAVNQDKFTKGTNPNTTNDDYSKALKKIEPFEFNTICVDTEENAVHLLLQAFIKRILTVGSLAQAVIAEKSSVAFDTRLSHAKAFNDNKVIYCLNAKVKVGEKVLEGYQVAARIAGMVGAIPVNRSLTHTTLHGYTELLEHLTNSEIIKAEKQGCLVLDYNSEKQIWIDNAINTLVYPEENQDDGWKKIRRTSTRFELLRRVNKTADRLVGKVDNDKNGRSTVIGQIQAVGDAMIAESKILAFKVYESKSQLANGDSAWFDIEIIDKDSMEHIYLQFLFDFNTMI